MASYHLAPSLVTLRSEANAAWPRRDKASDGWIGDTGHSARKSDHNPDRSAGGVVRAIDIDKDGINVDQLIDVVTSDRRTAYVIWNRRIWTPKSGWQKYVGVNGHTAHIHVSIRHDSASASSTAPWGLLASNSRPTSSQEDTDMPLTNDDLIMILDAKFQINQAGKVRTVSVKEALGAAFFYGDTLNARIAAVEAKVDAVPDKTATATFTKSIPRTGVGVTGNATLTTHVSQEDSHHIATMQAIAASALDRPAVVASLNAVLADVKLTATEGDPS